MMSPPDRTKLTHPTLDGRKLNTSRSRRCERRHQRPRRSLLLMSRLDACYRASMRGRLSDRASARCWCRPQQSPPAAIPAPWARTPSHAYAPPWARTPSWAWTPSWACAPHRTRTPHWRRRGAPGVSATPSRTPHAARTHSNEPSRTRTPDAAAPRVPDPAHLLDVRSLADHLFRFRGHPVRHRRGRR